MEPPITAAPLAASDWSDLLDVEPRDAPFVPRLAEIFNAREPDRVWQIAPQLGVLHTRGPWSFEATGTTYFFTDNNEFFGDKKLEQAPMFSVQSHIVRVFENRMWLSAGAAYAWAGESKIDGVHADDQKSNLLFGASFGLPVAESQSLRLGYVRGDTRTDVGSDTHNFYFTWSLRF